MDRQTLAIISIVGNSLSVVGSLYLAYDLLGGEHGPLRVLTRSVNYGAIFGIGFGVAFGPLAGLIIGVTHGITLGWELSLISRHRPKLGLWFDFAMSATRGLGYGIGTALLFGKTFGITFGVLSTIGQVIGYRAGIRPSVDYAPSRRPHMSRMMFLAVVNRTIAYAIGGYISAFIAHQRVGAILFGLKLGLLFGVVSAIVIYFLPLIEWRADHMPVRRMGVIGVTMIVLGFAVQSVQYWVTLLGISVR